MALCVVPATAAALPALPAQAAGNGDCGDTSGSACGCEGHHKKCGMPRMPCKTEKQRPTRVGAKARRSKKWLSPMFLPGQFT